MPLDTSLDRKNTHKKTQNRSRAEPVARGAGRAGSRSRAEPVSCGDGLVAKKNHRVHATNGVFLVIGGLLCWVGKTCVGPGQKRALSDRNGKRFDLLSCIKHYTWIQPGTGRARNRSRAEPVARGTGLLPEPVTRGAGLAQNQSYLLPKKMRVPHST